LAEALVTEKVMAQGTAKERAAVDSVKKQKAAGKRQQAERK
jgi:hypothetical protein